MPGDTTCTLAARPRANPRRLMGGAGRGRRQSRAYTEDTCSQLGGSLISALGDGVSREANTGVAMWTLTVPSGETLASATLWRAGDADGSAEPKAGFQVTLAAPTEDSYFDWCIAKAKCLAGEGVIGQPFASQNAVQIPSADRGGGRIFMTATCSGTPRPLSLGDRRFPQLCRCDLPLRCRSNPRTGPGTEREQRGWRTGKRVDGGRHERRDVQCERSRGGGVSGSLQRGRPGGAEPDGGRKRWALQERGADERWPSCVSLPAALPRLGQRGCGLGYQPRSPTVPISSWSG